MNKSFDLSVKSLLGEALSDEEREYLKEYNLRYALVRFLYTEARNKSRKEGQAELIDFHFTPGESFMEMSIYNIVKALLESDFESKSKPLNLSDLT